ncbi:Hypothetical predicted protein [Mytilus galloprovincialis]|uniref:Reverse transcriptase/retrotransposon-derived protein RNase H-like domain-containing protein n=1 Tax=Mytilus galloprovincialis TaxID=29158 RepID=A0A8B6CX96_MYTGA|nr:Hypothetical predicted protein [Mytilus galloprovincialis]VDI20886.1 Hypothetical predicted protein [Mytilus galloprovincialis]
MSFGVYNGQATCQRLMELVLNGIQWQICLIYLDDSIVFGKNFEEHTERLAIILCMGSYYRRFVKDFSSLVKPLTELTNKIKGFNWTQDCQVAFDKLKSVFTSPEIMAFPKDEGEFYLDTDASDIAIGAVLSKILGDQVKVISFGSRTINKAEKITA